MTSPLTPRSTPLFPLRRIVQSPNYHWWAYGAVAMGMLINVMDQSGINIALPEIADEFAADIPTVQWISLGYTLATSAMLMPMGRLSDMIGRKRVYLFGFFFFVVLAAVGGMSQTLGVLIAVKIVQGLASAGVQANSMALITEVFPDNQRGKAMGMYMAIIGSGAIMGPMVGGVLVSEFGWRSIFFAGIPVSILAMISAGLVLRGRTASQRAGRAGSSFDWVGAALSSGALVAFLLAMTNAWKLGWTAAPILAGFSASLVLLVGFILWELRTPDPMLDMSLFRNRVFSMAIGARFASFLGGSAIFFLMPFYLIQVLGYEARHAALLLVPGAVGMAVLGPLSGRLSDRFGTRWPATLGMLSSTIAMFTLSTVDVNSPSWHIVVGMVLSGIGMGTFSSPNTSAIMGSLPREKYGVVSGFVNLTRTSANVSGVALATTLVTITMASQGFEPNLSAVSEAGGTGVRMAFVEGLSTALRVSGAMMALALVLTVVRPDPQAGRQPGPVAASRSAAGDD